MPSDYDEQARLAEEDYENQKQKERLERILNLLALEVQGGLASASVIAAHDALARELGLPTTLPSFPSYTPLIRLPGVTRLVVVEGKEGRVFDKWNGDVQFSFQDWYRTLKIFFKWP